MAFLIVRLAGLWALLGGVCLGLVVLATVVNVAGFTLDLVVEPFGGSVPGLPGYEEAAALLVGVGALALFPYCQVRRGHVAVDIFMRAAPGPVRRGVDRVSTALMALTAAFLGVMMVRGGLESRADGIVTRVLGWPEWVFFLPAATSVFLWAAVAAIQVASPTEPGEPVDATKSADRAGPPDG